MKDELITLFLDILKDHGVSNVIPNVSRPENSQHGDYTTNVSLIAGSQIKRPPIEIAEDVKKKIEEWKKNNGKKKNYPVLSEIERVDVIPPGFINIFFTDNALIGNVQKKGDTRKVEGGTIMVEYAQPNTHKAFHIGHLRNIITGESVVRLLEENGNNVIRANYQGDVGLHIAKALYGLMHISKITNQKAKAMTLDEKVTLLSNAYVTGNRAYEEDEKTKKEIEEINKEIYAKDPKIYPLYEETRKWSLEYFDGIYKRLGTHFDRLYFESEVADLGKKLVLEALKKDIFEKSEGAIIFPGKKFGLHNRVFITSDGNPTYEGKDIGLAKLQFGEFHPELIIHCVSSEQTDYFRVLFEAVAHVFPKTRGKEYHLVYGWVRLKAGKMSSRTGNVILGEWLLNEVKKEIQSILKAGERKYQEEEKELIAETVTIAAVKYAFLKVSTAQDISFDIKESINVNGDSGPYLLYTYARARSVLAKALDGTPHPAPRTPQLNKEERDLSRLLLYFPEIVTEAGKNFSPNILCSYLFSLAQAFNLFYAKHQILGNDLRLVLTQKTAETLKKGLYLLGIETVERM